jgi:GNAT superfamily N-acetyltransferase
MLMTIALPISALAELADAFPGPQLAMVRASILAGNTGGQLWQLAQPSGPPLYLLWDQGNNVLYFSGEPQGAAPITQLAALVSGELRTQALAQNAAFFKLRTLSPAIEAALPAIFTGIELRDYPSIFYHYVNPNAPDPGQPALADLSFALIDGPLLARDDLAQIGGLREEIDWMWPTRALFIERGLGVAALSGASIVCRCTAEYLSPSMCGIGIETDEAQRGKGIATATAARFVAEALARGMRPYWECSRDNLASQRLAEKLGFTLLSAEPYRVGRFG